MLRCIVALSVAFALVTGPVLAAGSTQQHGTVIKNKNCGSYKSKRGGTASGC